MLEDVGEKIDEINMNDLARKAVALLAIGVEPLQGENIYDFVKRGEKVLKEKLLREIAEEEEHAAEG